MLERNGKVGEGEGTRVVHGRNTSREKPAGASGVAHGCQSVTQLLLLPEQRSHLNYSREAAVPFVW